MSITAHEHHCHIIIQEDAETVNPKASQVQLTVTADNSLFFFQEKPSQLPVLKRVHIDVCGKKSVE